MYKISLKSKPIYNKLHAVPQRGIISHSTLTSNRDSKFNMFHLHGEILGNTGFISFNRAHKNNTLSPTMIKELTRFLHSFDMESGVRGIWMSSNSDEIFSKGTDFKLLYHSILEKKPENAYNYLRTLYDFGVFLGKYNKPLLLNMKGEISNSAATIFSNLPFVLADKKSIWFLNETGLGYIPDSGSSYFLSRLAGELGTYLALTGNPLYAEDLIFANIAIDKIMNENYTKKLFKEENYEAHYPFTTLQTFFDPNLGKIVKKLEDEAFFDKALQAELNFRLSENAEDPRLVLSEIIYKKKMAQYANLSPEMNYIKNEPRPLINHTTRYRDDVIDNILSKKAKEFGKLSSLPLEAINRCFSGQTMEEIEEALKRENSVWAQETLNTFQKKSMLSLKLTLKLLREGIKSSWAECYSREFRVACRRINDEEFQKAIKTVLFERKKICYEWKYQSFREIPNDLVEGYFRPLDEDLKIPEYKPNIRPHALYPVKDYYEVLPDSIRFFLNEDSTYDINLRDDQRHSVKFFLEDNSIDYENPNYSTATLRENYFKRFELLRKMELEKNRAMTMLESEKNLELFYELRKKQINETFKNTEKIQKMINNSISRVFTDKFTSKYSKFKENCKLTHYQERREFFLNLKTFVFNKNFLYNPLDKEKLNKMARNAMLPLFFPEKDTESFLDVVNPEHSAEQYPPAKLTQFVKSSQINEEFSKLTVQPDEKINEFLNKNKEIFDRKVNERDLYFAPTEAARRINDKNIEFLVRFGFNRYEKPFRFNYIKSVLASAQKSKEIQTYIFKKMNKDNFNDFFFVNRQGAYKDIAREFIAQMKLQQKLQEISNSSGLDQSLSDMQEEIDKLKKISMEIKENDLMDLQTKNPLEFNSFQKLNPKNIMQHILFYLESDPELKKLFDPLVVQLNSKFGDSLRDKFLQLFLKIYEKNTRNLLKNEYKKFISAGVLLTRDGKTPFVLEKQDEYMQYFDDYVHKMASLDFHKLIMPDVLYIFSYFALVDLENTVSLFASIAKICENNINFPGLNEPIPNYTQRYNKYCEEILSKYKEFGFQFEKMEDLPETIDFLNTMCFNMGGIYSHTRDKIKFPHTRLYRNYQERINEEFDEKDTFLEKFTAEYEFEKDTAEKLKKLQDNHLKLLTNNEYDIENQNVEEWITSQQSQTYKDEENTVPNDQILDTGLGIFNYFVKLEGLTAKAINGKFNFLKNENVFPQKLENFPDYFGFKDQRQSAEKWLEDKIYEYFSKFFEIRFSVERLLTKNELVCLDLEMQKYFTPESIKKEMESQLFYELSILKLLRENYHFSKSFEENLELFMFKPPKLFNYYQQRLKNPEGWNKLMAFSISRLGGHSKKRTSSGSVEKKLADQKIYQRLLTELFETPQVERYTEQNRKKGYLEILSTAESKSGAEKLYKLNEMRRDSKYAFDNEMKEIFVNLQNQKEDRSQLKTDISDFFSKYNTMLKE